MRFAPRPCDGYSPVGEKAVIQSVISWSGSIDWWKTALAAGAGTPPTLAAIASVQAIVEKFGKRRLAVEHQLTDSEEIGNTINVVNISDKPLPISHVDVVWGRWRPWGKRVTYEPTDIEWSNGFTLAAHERRTMIYADADHFAWGALSHKLHGRLFVRVWLAGNRKPEWFRIT